MTLTHETNDDTEIDDENETPVSAFDRFVDHFSEQNLDSRVKTVTVVLLLILAVAASVIGWGLTRDFAVVWEGLAHVDSGGRVAARLDEKFAGFVGESPLLLVKEGEIWRMLTYAKAEQQTRGGQPVLNFQLDPKKQNLPNAGPVAVKIILKSRDYLNLLLEKSEGSVSGDMD